jgi:hypothetical protein
MVHTRINLRPFLALLLAALALAVPASALAHGGHVGPTQIVTQAIGPYELSITIEIPQGAPAPLYLIVAPQQDMDGATITLRAAPRGQSFASAAAAQVRTIPPQPLYNAQLEVDRAGDWELEVQVAGGRGGGVARIPFSIVIPPLPTATILLLAAIGGLILVMILNVALEGIARVRRRTLPGWVNRWLGYAIFACVLVAVIFGVQQFLESVQSAQAALGGPTATGRPHANAALRVEPPRGYPTPNAGQPLTLTFDLSDGSTGLPVDDLIPHHEALLHLVVISADGAFFAHLHPPRLAPGRFAISLTPSRSGRYTAYVEIQRQDSGVQVIARDFQVGGTETSPASPAPGLGAREVGDLHVTIASSLAPLRAGRQTTLTFSFSQGGAPVADMQPWLGMAGHLIARSADGAVYSHIHAAERTPPPGSLASTARYGPDIRFAYTFPQPGHYQLWGQFRRAGAIVTVPLIVEVEP